MPDFRTYIVGTNFHKGAKAAVEMLKEGEPVSLELDPTNAYDPNAIRVHNLSGQMLGHIPMDLSALITAMISEGFMKPKATIHYYKVRTLVIEFDFNSQHETLPEGPLDPREGYSIGDDH